MTSIEPALAAFYAAEYEQTLEALEGDQSAEACLLKSKIYRRLNHLPAALELLEGKTSAHPLISSALASNLTLLYASTGHLRAASEQYSLVDLPLLQSEASVGWLAADAITNIAAYYLILRDRKAAGDLLESAQFRNNLNAKIAAQRLLSLVAESRAKSIAQAIKGLQFGLRAKAPDRGHMAMLLHHAAEYMSLVGASAEQRNFILESARAFDWPASHSEEKAAAFQALGKDCAVRADYALAFQFLALAESALGGTAQLHRASGIVSRLSVRLTRAWTALLAGELFSGRADLSVADELERHLTYGQPFTSEHYCLLVGVQLFAEVDSIHARSLLKAYELAKSRLAATWMRYHDGDPEYLYARACVEFGAGNFFAVPRYADEAARYYDELEFQWNAAQCVLLSLRATKNEDYLIDLQRRLAALGPSFLDRQLLVLDHPVERTPSDILTPKQRFVFSLLLEGLTPEEIGTRLSSSPNTVRVHVQKIYKAFGVHTRAQLVAKATTREDQPGSLS